jgi:hypothetical protein
MMVFIDYVTSNLSFLERKSAAYWKNNVTFGCVHPKSNLVSYLSSPCNIRKVRIDPQLSHCCDL